MQTGPVKTDRRRDRYIRIACSNVHTSIRSLEDQVAIILRRLNAPAKAPSPALADIRQLYHGTPALLCDDPLLHIGFEKVSQLIGIYDDEVARMYPVVEKESLLDQARTLFSGRTGTGGQLQVGGRTHPVDHKCKKFVIYPVPTSIGMADTFISFQSVYHLQNGEDLQAWRLTRFTINEILALRLHTKEGWSEISDPREYSLALRVFWSAYVLDMRNSFGNNMPPALGNADIDPSIPEPPQFLHGLALSKDNGFLDFQITQWYEKLPPRSQFSISEPDDDIPGSHQGGSSSSRSNESLLPFSLRVSLYLRRNQMRIWLNKPALQSVAAARRNSAQAEIALHCANDTIQALTHVAGQHAVPFKAKPAVLDYFLVSALAVFFPAVAHGPLEFVPLCEDGFRATVELITNKPETYLSERLQRFIYTVRDFVKRKYGVESNPVVMGNTASHSPATSTGTGPTTQRDLQGVTDELRSLFGVAVACGTIQTDKVFHHSPTFQTSREAAFPDEVMVASATDRNDMVAELQAFGTMAGYGYDELSDILGDLH
ncbi:fungal specific transcription factor [Penicillium longicatenatum]|uniref:fungal specific transcription factor n=1 Tax=Penicillium longicatenatum TaxID=1561947 RepID=UPI002548C7E5|nr:fungal specific transcription factor [Penicillium longicatenatum]KAJ5657112.1 fungal specific transcription factor [Penicillium longicatenatum]